LSLESQRHGGSFSGKDKVVKRIEAICSSDKVPQTRALARWRRNRSCRKQARFFSGLLADCGASFNFTAFPQTAPISPLDFPARLPYPAMA
jgi:hypothetical protein